MSVATQPTAKQFTAQVGRVARVRDYVRSMDGTFPPAVALGGLAVHLLDQVLARALAAPEGSTARLSAYAELQAVPDFP